MSDTAPLRTDRVDFQATSDPGLLEASDRGEVKLLKDGFMNGPTAVTLVGALSYIFVVGDIRRIELQNDILQAKE